MANAHSVVTVVTVTKVEPVSPAFVRVEFAGSDLADFGVAGPVYDQRIKLIFPAESGRLPAIGSGDDWYSQWLELPEAERGAMRTYSIRDLRGEGADRRLVVDFVLHLEPGATGPASRWASQAGAGDQLIVVGPRRGASNGGIEFAPGTAERVLLAGDETAVPAISRILADLPASAVGDAFLEVPSSADIVPVAAPAGVTLRWLPRGGGTVGAELVPAVLAHLGTPSRPTPSADPGPSADSGVVKEGVLDTVWETPTFSGSGEELAGGAPSAAAVPGGVVAGLYAWIAGESTVVTTIRRHLVTEAGLRRDQVAFMGYWRKGVAMRG